MTFKAKFEAFKKRVEINAQAGTAFKKENGSMTIVLATLAVAPLAVIGGFFEFLYEKIDQLSKKHFLLKPLKIVSAVPFGIGLGLFFGSISLAYLLWVPMLIPGAIINRLFSIIQAARGKTHTSEQYKVLAGTAELSILRNCCEPLLLHEERKKAAAEEKSIIEIIETARAKIKGKMPDVEKDFSIEANGFQIIFLENVVLHLSLPPNTTAAFTSDAQIKRLCNITLFFLYYFTRALQTLILDPQTQKNLSNVELFETALRNAIKELEVEVEVDEALISTWIQQATLRLEGLPPFMANRNKALQQLPENEEPKTEPEQTSAPTPPNQDKNTIWSEMPSGLFDLEWNQKKEAELKKEPWTLALFSPSPLIQFTAPNDPLHESAPRKILRGNTMEPWLEEALKKELERQKKEQLAPFPSKP